MMTATHTPTKTTGYSTLPLRGLLGVADRPKALGDYVGTSQLALKASGRQTRFNPEYPPRALNPKRQATKYTRAVIYPLARKVNYAG